MKKNSIQLRNYHLKRGRNNDDTPVYPVTTVDNVKGLEDYVPGGTSEGVVVDPNYVHTDNNYTDADKAKLSGLDNRVETLENSDFVTAETVADIVVGTSDVVIVETPNHICITFVTTSISFTPNTTMSLWSGQKVGTLTISGTHLKQDITLTVPANFTAQISGGIAAQSITIPQTDGEITGVSVTITYTGADSGSYNGSITATSGSTTASVNVVYSQYQGATIIAGTISTINAAMGGSQVGELNVSGVNLEGDITASVGSGDFTICATQNGTYGTTATISKSSAEASGGATLYVKYTPSSGTSTASGTLTLSTPRDGNTTTESVSLSGKVAGTLSITPSTSTIGIASGGSGTTQFTVQGANLTPATTTSVSVSGTGMSADKQTLTVGQDGTINEVVTVTFSSSADSNGTLTVSHADVDNDATASVVGVITTPLPVGYYFDKDKVRYTVLSGQQTVSAKKVDTTTTAGAIEIPASVSDLGLEATDGTNTATGTGMTYSVTNIPDNAFLNCSSITSLVINANVSSLPNQAFANVGNGNGVTLSRITVGASVTSINQYCFYGAKPVILDIYGNPYVGNSNCSGNNKLEKVIIRGSGVASATASSFNTPSLQNGKCRATLYVPDDLIDDYRAKEYIGTAGVASGVSYCAFPDEGQIKGISELS